MEGSKDYTAGYAGACRLFGRNGTYPAGFGLCGFTDQWSRRHTGTYTDIVETIEPVSDSGFFVHK